MEADAVVGGMNVDGGAHQQLGEPSRNSKRQRRLLNWRMDPDESHSDFIIEIAAAVSEQGGAEDSCNDTKDASVDVYHVHKAYLEFGEHSSGYFAGLIASQTAESKSNKTRIQLKCQSATKAFPILLDYIYGLDHGEPELTIENAAPLYYLADYFEVEVLHPKILGFWNKMQVDDFAICLQQAFIYHIDSLHENVVKKCSENIADIAVDSPLLEASDSTFWLAVQKEMYQSQLGSHLHWISLLAEFCVRRKNGLDIQTFKNLARLDPSSVPFDAAMNFLEAQKSIAPASFEGNEVSLFQRAMLEALTRDWKFWKDSANTQDMLKKISPSLFSLAMNMALEQADEESDAFDTIAGKAVGALPTTISITGAGINAVNGVYSRPANFVPKKPKYVMKGCWEGCDDASFSIKLCPTGPTRIPTWFISVKKAGGDAETDLYDCHPFTPERLLHLPRMKGWWCHQAAGVNSNLPTLTYHFN